jgi:uncharacterized membrane protein
MRLLLKTLSYGATHIAVATTVAYLLTGDLLVALGLGLIEPIVQTGVFALHEQLWEGKRNAAGYDATGHGPLQPA